MFPLTSKVPVERNGAEYKTNEREGSIHLVRRGRHLSYSFTILVEVLLTL
jgi:hypothetical protein